MTPTPQEIMDRPGALGHDQAKWRAAFDYANRSNAIEGLPPPSELGTRVQEWVIDGRFTIHEGVVMLVRHYKGVYNGI